MRISIKFYPKEPKKESTVLFATVHYLGKRYRIFTGEKILTEYWMQDAQKSKYSKLNTDADTTNERLDVWRDVIQRAIAKFSPALYPPDPDELKREIKRLKLEGSEKSDMLIPWVAEFIPKSGRALSTRTRYNTTLGFLKRYQAETRQIRFADIDIKFYREFKSWMERKKYSLNTFGTAIKHIKVWMNEAEDEIHHGITGHLHPKFICSSETADAVYLSVDELMKIHQLEISWETILDTFPKIEHRNINRKVTAMKLARDRFLIGAFTGLRVSDFIRITEANIKDNFIRIKPVKGAYISDDVVIPIHPVIRDIITSGFDFSVKAYDQKINKQIKDIGMMAGLNEPVFITRTTGGKKETTMFKKYQVITTHTARRSAATNMYKAGIPTLAIMKITGHRTENSFLKYIKISQEENAAMLGSHPYFGGGSELP